MGTVRGLRWPPLQAVDLRDELPWLLVDTREGGAGDGPAAARESPGKSPTRARNAASPYRQKLLAARQAPTELSPAQRAARKILQVKSELLQLSASETPDESVEDMLDQVQAAAVTTSKSPTRPQRGVIEPNVATSPAKPRSPVKNASATVSRSRKKRGRSPEKPAAEHNLRDNQIRLASWLATHRQRSDERLDMAFSTEIETRVAQATTCQEEIGQNDGLWTDPVRSLIAAEMTSEAVFGGFVPTRRLAFDPPSPSKNQGEPVSSSDVLHSPTQLTVPVHDDSASHPELVDQHSDDSFVTEQAAEIRALAAKQVADGSVEDALVTLQTGIHQMLYEFQDNHAEIQCAGFNYSAVAHRHATVVQLQYRRRHRKRVSHILVLQRCWRAFRAKRTRSKTRVYDNEFASVIQRWYRCRHRHLCALRVQTCFRVWRSQKHIIHFHQAVRLLLSRVQHQRELEMEVARRRQRMWSKLQLVLRVIRLWQLRRHSITCLQKRWKGIKTREQYASKLLQLRESERERRLREDAFVSSRLAAAMDSYRSFLASSRRGQDLVKRHDLLPWFRFERIQQSGKWRSLALADRIELVASLYRGRRVNGMAWRGLARVVLGEDGQPTMSTFPLKEAIVSVAGLGVLHHAVRQDTCVVEERSAPTRLPRLQKLRQHLKQRGQKLHARVVDSLWQLVFYPLHRFTRSSSKNTRERLTDNAGRVLRSYLRVSFRRQAVQNEPRQVCESCLEPFATVADLFAHRRRENPSGIVCALAEQQANAEWCEVLDDTTELNRRSERQTVWHKVLARFRRNQPPPANDLGDATPFGAVAGGWSFSHVQLCDGIIQKLRRDRRAFRLLVNVILSVSDINSTGIPVDLVSAVLQILGGFSMQLRPDTSNGLLALTALDQPVRWNLPTTSATLSTEQLLELLGPSHCQQLLQSMRPSIVVQRWRQWWSSSREKYKPPPLSDTSSTASGPATPAILLRLKQVGNGKSSHPPGSVTPKSSSAIVVPVAT